MYIEELGKMLLANASREHPVMSAPAKMTQLARRSEFSDHRHRHLTVTCKKYIVDITSLNLGEWVWQC